MDEREENEKYMEKWDKEWHDTGVNKHVDDALRFDYSSKTYQTNYDNIDWSQ